MHHLTLERDAVDLVIVSQLCSSLQCGDMTQNTMRWVNTGRKKGISQYIHPGKNICHELFKFIHGVEKGRLGNLIKHYRLHGVIPRQRGNKNTLPKHSLSSKWRRWCLLSPIMQKSMAFFFLEEYRATRETTSSYCRPHAPWHQCCWWQSMRGQAHVPEAVADVQARGFTHVTHDGCVLAVPEKHHLNTKSSHPDRWGRLNLWPQLSNTWPQQQHRESTRA